MRRNNDTRRPRLDFSDGERHVRTIFTPIKLLPCSAGSHTHHLELGRPTLYQPSSRGQVSLVADPLRCHGAPCTPPEFERPISFRWGDLRSQSYTINIDRQLFGSKDQVRALETNNQKNANRISLAHLNIKKNISSRLQRQVASRIWLTMQYEIIPYSKKRSCFLDR